jgi:hypothetical protein
MIPANVHSQVANSQTIVKFGDYLLTLIKYLFVWAF